MAFVTQQAEKTINRSLVIILNSFHFKAATILPSSTWMSLRFVGKRNAFRVFGGPVIFRMDDCSADFGIGNAPSRPLSGSNWAKPFTVCNSL